MAEQNQPDAEAEAKVVRFNLDRFYHREVDQVAARLRSLAEEVEKRGHRVYDNPSDGEPDYLSAATEVVHKVQWGIANLPLDTLLSGATEVDRYVRKPEVSGD